MYRSRKAGVPPGRRIQKGLHHEKVLPRRCPCKLYGVAMWEYWTVDGQMSIIPNDTKQKMSLCLFTLPFQQTICCFDAVYFCKCSCQFQATVIFGGYAYQSVKLLNWEPFRNAKKPSLHPVWDLAESPHLALPSPQHPQEHITSSWKRCAVLGLTAALLGWAVMILLSHLKHTNTQLAIILSSHGVPSSTLS